MALIGQISIAMTTDARAFTKGILGASKTLNAFGKIASTTFKANPFFTMLAGGVTAAKGVKQLGGFGKAFREASQDARVMAKAGLLDASNGLRIFRNLAGDTVPAMAHLATGVTVMGVGFTRLGLRTVAGGFRMVSAAAGKVVAVTRESANVLGRGLAIGGGVAALGLYKAARAASSLAEQTDRARNTFGAASGDIIKQANIMGEAFGVSKSMFVESASALGGQFKGLGYADKDAVALGVHLTKLAVDAKSRFQIPMEEAMTRMASAVAGEAESVRRWGVDLTEANLKIKAQKMGIKALGGELTQAQKSQVRVALIEEKLAGVHGDLAKTAGGAENATAGLMGRLENLAATVGTALLPIVGSAMLELQAGVEALSMTWSAMTKGIVNDQVGVVGAVGETAGAMGYLQKAIGFVADEFQVVKMGFYLVQSYVTAGIAKIVDAFGALGNAIDYAVEKFGGAKLGIGDVMNAYSADLKRLSESQYGSYQQELMKGPASEGVNAMFAAAQARIKAAQAEAMKPGVDVTKLAPKSEAAEKKAGESKFASAAQAGSKEATNAILQSRYGAAAGKQPEEQTARNTTTMVAILNKIAVNTGANAGAAAGSALASLF